MGRPMGSTDEDPNPAWVKVWVQRHFQDWAPVGLSPGEKAVVGKNIPCRANSKRKGADGLAEAPGSGTLVPGVPFIISLSWGMLLEEREVLFWSLEILPALPSPCPPPPAANWTQGLTVLLP